MFADDVLYEFIHSELVNYVTNKKNDDENSKTGDLSPLEYAGFITGFRIIERLTKDWPRFQNELETVKFICTDFWSSVYKKQIDNLRTNHQGVYVLQDNSFRFLNKISASKQYLEHAPKVKLLVVRNFGSFTTNADVHSHNTRHRGSLSVAPYRLALFEKKPSYAGVKFLNNKWYVSFTCGLLRGALANLGINCLVTAEIQPMPCCKFHIQVHKGKKIE